MKMMALPPAIERSSLGSTDLGAELVDKASEITRLLRDLTRFDGFNLTAWDPLSGSHRHKTLSTDGFSDALLSHLNDKYCADCLAFSVSHARDHAAPRWRDCERMSFRETAPQHKYCTPAGFDEGTTMSLRLPNGRYTGSLHVKWDFAPAATDQGREIIEGFRPLLAAVCDLLRIPQLLADAVAPNAFALIVSLNGLAHHLPGRSMGPHLDEGGALRRLLLKKLKNERSTPRRFVWPDETGCCHKVVLTPCRDNLTIITEQLVMWPYGLTVREIQVLHLVAYGASNSQIAERLFVSVRTISTHVEHILAKMNCSSRASLAATAVAEGLLLVEDPSRKSPETVLP